MMEEKTEAKKIPRILIVDDYPAILKSVKGYLGDILEDLGFKESIVHTAENGRIALEMITKEGEYDLILSDYEMPEVDGIGLYKGLAPTQQEKVIFVTGISSELEKKLQPQLRPNDYKSPLILDKGKFHGMNVGELIKSYLEPKSAEQ